MSCNYLAHSELPLPALFKHIKPTDELQNALQQFLDRHVNDASYFTIDHDNVGRGLVCAFTNDGSMAKANGIMLYAKKQEIQDYLTNQGFQCAHSSTSSVIQCHKKKHFYGKL